MMTVAVHASIPSCKHHLGFYWHLLQQLQDGGQALQERDCLAEGARAADSIMMTVAAL
jgi:hypothetical protein